MHESRTFTYSRDITAQSCDSYDVVNEHSERDGRRTFVVRLKRGRDARQTTFRTFRSNANRWYVEDADVGAVADFCQNMPGR